MLPISFTGLAYERFKKLTPKPYLINMKAMYFATSVGRLTGEGGKAVWNTSQWTSIRSTPGRE